MPKIKYNYGIGSKHYSAGWTWTAGAIPKLVSAYLLFWRNKMKKPG